MSNNSNLNHTLASWVSLAAIGCVLSACNAGAAGTTSKAEPVQSVSDMPKSHTLFTEIYDVIPFEDVKRRKFDNIVIADLDQDGLNDLVINDHAREMRLY